MSKQGKPPTGEIGAQLQGSGTLPAWANFVYDDLETVPELMFPQSVRTYSAMRNDSQLDGLYAGATWPILRYKFQIDPNGCDDTKVRRLAKDLNLPLMGDDPAESRGRMKKKFGFRQHVADALLSIIYGFYYFEQVGVMGDDGFWHLRKLAPRPPATIDRINPAADGGLLSIQQNIGTGKPLGTLPEIPVDRLVGYVWDKEGANWYGRSMFRSCYRNWLIKDRLLRVDAIKHERNGVGIPLAEGAPGMTDAELKSLALYAQQWKAGEQSGGAIPAGAKLTLQGTQGSIPDTIASIRFHNEEMARRFLMMFLQLGDTLHGSRALGKDFINYFQIAQEQLANFFCDTFTEHVIEDYWDWNYGEDEDLAPRLVYERDDDPKFAAADLALMIQNNVIQVDDQLELAVREAMDLPSRDDATVRVAVPDTPSPPGDQLGQPSTQPGNADPAFPDQNPDVKAKRGSGGGAASSPADAAAQPALYDHETMGV